MSEPLALSKRVAAQMLGICTKTLDAEVDAGRIRCILIGPGERRKFTRADLEKYMERRACQKEDEENRLSSDLKTRRSGTRISPLAVLDFEEALKRVTNPKLMLLPSGSRRKPSAARTDQRS